MNIENKLEVLVDSSITYHDIIYHNCSALLQHQKKAQGSVELSQAPTLTSLQAARYAAEVLSATIGEGHSIAGEVGTTYGRLSRNTGLRTSETLSTWESSRTKIHSSAMQMLLW